MKTSSIDNLIHHSLTVRLTALCWIWPSDKNKNGVLLSSRNDLASELYHMVVQYQQFIIWIRIRATVVLRIYTRLEGLYAIIQIVSDSASLHIAPSNTRELVVNIPKWVMHNFLLSSAFKSCQNSLAISQAETGVKLLTNELPIHEIHQSILMHVWIIFVLSAYISDKVSCIRACVENDAILVVVCISCSCYLVYVLKAEVSLWRCDNSQHLHDYEFPPGQTYRQWS